MSRRVGKWGHSMAIRIPKTHAEQLGWNVNTAVELHVEEGRLVMEAVCEPFYTLEELVAGITPENRHGETTTGHSVGNEVW